TPVLAFPNGAAPEVVVDGVSGFLCADVEQMASRAKEVEALDRTGCRAYVDAHFSDVAMTDRYEAVYRRLTAFAALGAPVRLPARSSATRSGYPTGNALRSGAGITLGPPGGARDW